MQVMLSVPSVNPAEQPHVKEPGVFVHTGVQPGKPPQVQLNVPRAHSSASEAK